MSDHQSSERANIERELLAAYLADRDVACTKCRHNLRGITSGVCPECGHEIVITVGHVDQSTMPWIMAMALYGMAIMLCGLGTLSATAAIPEGGATGAELTVLAASAAAMTVAVAGFALLTLRRERVWASPILIQCAIVLSVLLVPFTALVVAMIALAIVT